MNRRSDPQYSGEGSGRRPLPGAPGVSRQAYFQRHAFELYVHLIGVPPAVVVVAPWSLLRQNCPAE